MISGTGISLIVRGFEASVKTAAFIVFGMEDAILEAVLSLSRARYMDDAALFQAIVESSGDVLVIAKVCRQQLEKLYGRTVARRSL